MTLVTRLRSQLNDFLCTKSIFSGGPSRASFLGLAGAALISLAQVSLSQAAELVGATAGELGVSPSGSATYSIPIAVPAGTTGLQPKITLQYDSMAGNGPAGMGWSIGGLSVIGRCPTSYNLDGTAAGAPGLDPVDYDANDKFCLNGQRLVPVAGAYGANGTEYRTTQEEFSKIVSYGTAGSGPQWFKVWRKSGEIMEFGNTADSRIESLGRSDVFVWAINKLSDTVGNYETFSYTEDTVNGGYRVARIDYTGNDTQGLTPYNRVEFIYATRPDKMKSWQAGSKMILDQRLTNIKVYADSTLYRDYQVAYETTLPLSGRSRPISVTECATNTTTSSLDCFPPTTFQWSADGVANLTTVSLAGTPGINITYDDYNVVGTGDFNGDGLTDLYLVWTSSEGQASGTASKPDYVWLANGSGGFTVVAQPSSTSLLHWFAVASTGDFNGDGLTDIYTYLAENEFLRVKGIATDYVLLSNGNGTFTKQVVGLTGSAMAAYKVSGVGDFNGDGLTDLYFVYMNNTGQAGGSAAKPDHVWLANGTGGFTDIVMPAATSVPQWFSISASGDFNGDGLTDFYAMFIDIRSRKGGTASDRIMLSKWAPNGSSGTLSFDIVTVPFAQSVVNGNGIGANGDYNGDGLTDLLVFGMDNKARALGNNTDKIWLAKGDGTFDVVTGFPTADQMIQETRVTATGDFDGDGFTDHYVMPTRDESPSGMKALDTDYILRSRGDGSFQKVPLTGTGHTAAMEWHQIKAIGDFDGDGLTDLYSFKAQADGRSSGNANDYIFKSSWKFPDQLEGVTNGLGLSTKLVYKPMTDATVYTKGTGSTYPVQEVLAPRYVVSQVRADNGIGGENAQNYKYQAMRAHLNDIGNLGFAKTTVWDTAKNITTESVYSQNWAAGTEGLLLSSKTIAPAPYNVTLAEQTTSWVVASATTADGTPRKFRYSPSSTTVRKDLNGVLLGTVTETTAYDDGAGNYFANYGFPRQASVTTVEPDNSVTYTKTTTNTYTHDATNWLLGRLTGASVVHQETGKPSITRSSSFTYDSATGLITSETVEPGSPLFHTKTYGYNGFGAVTSLTETWGSQNADSVRAPGP